MIDYRCSKCGLTGHKLWRQSHVCADQIDLLCATCAESDQKESHPGEKIEVGKSYVDGHLTDQLGSLVPAIPVEDEDTFWGYTSTPNEGCLWWHQLPTFKDAPAREREWLDAWLARWERNATYEAKELGETFQPERPGTDEPIEDRRARLGRLQEALQGYIGRALAKRGIKV
jgi:hypothetical protein